MLPTHAFIGKSHPPGSIHPYPSIHIHPSICSHPHPLFCKSILAKLWGQNLCFVSSHIKCSLIFRILWSFDVKSSCFMGFSLHDFARIGLFPHVYKLSTTQLASRSLQILQFGPTVKQVKSWWNFGVVRWWVVILKGLGEICWFRVSKSMRQMMEHVEKRRKRRKVCRKVVRSVGYIVRII